MAYDEQKMGAFGDGSPVSDEETRRREEWEKMQAATSSFIADLSQEATSRIRRRSYIERRWVDDLRQYHGMYDVSTEKLLNADPDRSKIFINITRPKTRAWRARLGDMLFPNDDRNWGIERTPVPELTDAAKAAVREAEDAEAKAQQAVNDHNDMAANGAPPEQLAAKQAEAEGHASVAKEKRDYDKEFNLLSAEADRRAQRMQTEIEDQLDESLYPKVCRDVIEDMCKLGVGVLKGPLTASKPRRRWTKVAEGQFVDGSMEAYKLTIESDPRPMFRRVNPWHFFPDPDATDISESESTFERILLSKTAFRRMAKMMGWHAPTVAEILKSSPDPTSSSDFQWLSELRMMDDKAENNFINRYCVWEYHGPMEYDDIITMLTCLGRVEDAKQFMDSVDPLDTTMVICHFSQNRLLKIEEYFPLDSGESLYSVVPFEKSEATILGAVGVPWLMRHEQSMLNSAVRMMMDNGGLSVGPQVVIDQTQIEPMDGSWKLRPRKIWKKKAQDLGKEGAPFATYNIPMNQAQLAGIIELALRFIDDVISMPTIAQGEQGAHVTQTANGMSMLFNSANVVFREVVKNWDDDLTTPTIRRAFDWNMQFNPNNDIKGDMQAVARGTSVLLVREVQSQQLMMIAQAWTTHPVIGPAIKVYDILRMTLQALSINPNQVLCDEDEFQRRLKAMADSQGQDNPEQIRAQTALEVAKINAQSRMEAAQSQMEIAQLNQKTEVMKLIQKDGVDFESIKAMLSTEKMKTDSKERIFAAEAAIEQQNAQAAEARGEQPKGSGGYISGGSLPQQ